MLCPNCAAENPEDAGQCMKCGYKFRFGYAFNDPKRMTFLNLANNRGEKYKTAGYAFIILFLLIFILVIYTWFKSV